MSRKTVIYLISLKITIYLFSLSSPAIGGVDCHNNRTINLTNKEIFKNLMKQSVFQVVVASNGPPRKEETIGTATLISEDGYLLTAAHIFETDKRRIFDGLKSKKMSLLLRIPLDEKDHLIYKGEYAKRLSDKYDISVIKLADWDNNRKYRAIELDVKRNPHDTDARLMGYIANERYPTLSETGNVLRTSRLDGYLRATSLAAYQGYSGGLLVGDRAKGIALLSGKYVQTEDNNVDWADIGDIDNGALIAVPLSAVIDKLSELKLENTDKFIRKLKGSEKTIPAYDFSDLIKNDRLAAIALAYRLKTLDNIVGLSNKDNKWNVFELVHCLMPSEIAKNIILSKINLSGTETDKQWFNNEVAKYTLKIARESDDIEYSLANYDLATAAITNGNFDEAYTNYAYLDFYKAAMRAENMGISVIGEVAPATILSIALKNIVGNNPSHTAVPQNISHSRSLLFSAATVEFDKIGNYYEGSLAASAAILSQGGSNKALTKDFILLNSKAINSTSDEMLRKELMNDREAINVINSDSGYKEYVLDTGKLSFPSDERLLNSAESLQLAH